ncbi:MAG: Na(+)-translocating NADH-quinone reductase subunit A [Clostridium sp.]|nr:Na(+)-translocating NADH-quinone reductase subunit A [Clostridium sp.]
MRTIHLKKGLDLKLKGEAAAAAPAAVAPRLVALVPDDFPGLTLRPAVKEGERVVAGQPLMTDKLFPEIALTSPVAGEVTAVVRGERRKLMRVVVTPDSSGEAVAFDTAAAAAGDPAVIRALLTASGLWAMLRQRPYDIVPSPETTPRDIFVTGFDSAPLAPSLPTILADRKKEIAAGVAALARLTSGKVYIGVRPGEESLVPAGAEGIVFEGPHPAGNAGIQAAAIAPVNKGETIWTLDLTTVARIGSLIETGKADYTTTVAVTGSEITNPLLVRTLVGADLGSILEGNLAKADHHQRIIAGNVLTGVRSDIEGFLRWPYRQVTVIPEGDDVDEFMGWASNSLNKMSESRSFLSHFLGGRRFAPDARLNGGRRAMIMSGQYEKVLPMDIMPEYLIKAIIARDIDRMEQLGIYEVAPEDFALCEYVDPSKLELQKIVREGLDYLRKELS